jgi:dimethylargininase
LGFSRAIVRPPGPNFAAGLSSAGNGTPNFPLALHQHRAYCAALVRCGLELTYLESDPAFPDGTFVEDTAIVTPRGAILTRPGAPSRIGEILELANSLRALFPRVLTIDAPGTVDGGDICDADGHFLIGVSTRTNPQGATQLRNHLEALGYTASVVDIRSSATLLHLKTGIAYLGDGVWVVAAAVGQELDGVGLEALADAIRVAPAEGYAANCVRVNDRVLVPDGYPGVSAAIAARGLNPLPLAMSEFKKMDGGLSCLSLRF